MVSGLKRNRDIFVGEKRHRRKKTATKGCYKIAGDLFFYLHESALVFKMEQSDFRGNK